VPISIEQRLSDKLAGRQFNNNLRELPINKDLVDFSSNDYLGLARSEVLTQKIQLEYDRLPSRNNGSTGSRLLTGNSAYAMGLEKYLAEFFRAESSLLFNSGYSANLSLISALPGRGDTILYDELSHACIKEGARLSLARHFSFLHNDIQDLKAKLHKSEGEVFIVVESVYSMDGDPCPLMELVDLTGPGVNLIVDEAHATGNWGEAGTGLAGALGLEDKILARVYTFGKAMGVHGACVTGSKVLIRYLINFARPFIYTTALPLHSLVSIQSAFHYLEANPELRMSLNQNINLFKNLFQKETSTKWSFIASNSPIQALLVPGNERVKGIAEQVGLAGFQVSPILSPTVKEGAERLRICLHSFNSKEDVEGLFETIKNL